MQVEFERHHYDIGPLVELLDFVFGGSADNRKVRQATQKFRVDLARGDSHFARKFCSRKSKHESFPIAVHIISECCQSDWSMDGPLLRRRQTLHRGSGENQFGRYLGKYATSSRLVVW